ncbi:YfiT family bacillithiol transferase [Sphingobacterium corticis]|uniref:YfiT family bacillithiol transferase n=1 Tax=Sphingobacterium corticis TaxID=1812823 RepID=A0ABW5NJZ0_9SPHI
MEDNIEKLKYPIGRFRHPERIDRNDIREWIQTIKDFPAKIHKEVAHLTKEELAKQYRPNGWTISQVVNHCADSHMNSFIRFKLTLTENTPTIKPYFENVWAELSDSKYYPVRSSLLILEGLHERWVNLMESLSDEDLEKEFLHPENKEKISLKTNIGIYAWHCEHHLAHIVNAKQN